jgi:uncharacterized protein YjiS (DUF1127 family)
MTTTTLAAPTITLDPTAISSRIAAAIRAHLERMKERQGYRQMLARDDDMLRDMGVTRDDVRHALNECPRWF